MKKIVSALLLALCFAAATITPAAETKAAARAPAPSLAGEFAGEWMGENGVGGKLKLALKAGKDAAWAMEASFTFDGTVIPTTIKSVKVEGAKLETEFAWDVQGTSASSKLKGELKGEVIEGTYESTTTEGAGKGTWKVTRAPAGK